MTNLQSNVIGVKGLLMFRRTIPRQNALCLQALPYGQFTIQPRRSAPPRRILLRWKSRTLPTKPRRSGPPRLNYPQTAPPETYARSGAEALAGCTSPAAPVHRGASLTDEIVPFDHSPAARARRGAWLQAYMGPGDNEPPPSALKILIPSVGRTAGASKNRLARPVLRAVLRLIRR